VVGQQDYGAESSTVRRRLSALSSFYRYCGAHDLVDRIPTAGVARPVVDPDYTATVGLARDQARALNDEARGRRRRAPGSGPASPTRPSGYAFKTTVI
jgi:site-specific recombinase XerD